MSGIRPTRAKAQDQRTSEAATTMSQAAASGQAGADGVPLDRGDDGLLPLDQQADEAVEDGAAARAPASGVSPVIAPTSPPDEKVPPAPVSTTARTAPVLHRIGQRVVQRLAQRYGQGVAAAGGSFSVMRRTTPVRGDLPRLGPDLSSGSFRQRRRCEVHLGRSATRPRALAVRRVLPDHGEGGQRAERGQDHAGPGRRGEARQQVVRRNRSGPAPASPWRRARRPARWRCSRRTPRPCSARLRCSARRW